MLKSIAQKPAVRAVRTEALALFTDRTLALESHVNQLLQLAGWTGKRFGCAARGEFYIGKCGDFHGEHIGLWSTNKYDGAVALWPVTASAKTIVEAILVKTQGSLEAATPDALPAHPLAAYMH